MTDASNIEQALKDAEIEIEKAEETAECLADAVKMLRNLTFLNIDARVNNIPEDNQSLLQLRQSFEGIDNLKVEWL